MLAQWNRVLRPVLLVYASHADMAKKGRSSDLYIIGLLLTTRVSSRTP